MVKIIKVDKRFAALVKKLLVDNDLMSRDYRSFKEDNDRVINFPMTTISSDEAKSFLKVLKKTIIEAEDSCDLDSVDSVVGLVEGDAPVKKLKNPDLREELKKILDPNEEELIRKSQDVIGRIAIIEVPDELSNKEREIGKIFLRCNPSVSTVLKKGKHEGVFRVQELKFLAGVDERRTVHRENGVKIVVDVEKVYFSPRMANERLRIAKLVNPGEDVLVMFSGAAPYPLVIAKNSLANSIDGVEINPEGKACGDESLRINKITNVRLFTGDVNEVVPLLAKEKSYDRVVMPAPHNADSYLGVALGALKEEGGFIHFYDFVHEDDFNKRGKELVEEARANGWSAVIKSINKVGQNKPRMYRTCYDLELRPLR